MEGRGERVGCRLLLSEAVGVAVGPYMSYHSLAKTSDTNINIYIYIYVYLYIPEKECIHMCICVYIYIDTYKEPLYVCICLR